MVLMAPPTHVNMEYSLHERRWFYIDIDWFTSISSQCKPRMYLYLWVSPLPFSLLKRYFQLYSLGGKTQATTMVPRNQTSSTVWFVASHARLDCYFPFWEILLQDTAKMHNMLMDTARTRICPKTPQIRGFLTRHTAPIILIIS